MGSNIMTRNFTIILIHLLTLVYSDMSPNPNPYYVTNVDGVSQGPINLKGSVRYSWEEDEEGFTVLPNENHTYYYAKKNSITGDIVATTVPIRMKVNGNLVGDESLPASLGITQHEQPSEKVKQQKCGDFCGKAAPSLISTTGVLKTLIVLFKFKDHTTRSLPSVSDITKLMNHPGDGVSVAYDPLAPTGSVREHYLKSSYGKLDINAFIANWVTIDYTESYCSGGKSGLASVIHICLQNALSKADVQINFIEFDLDGNRLIDTIGFLHSGYGAEWGGTDAYGASTNSRIWSHQWSFSTPWQSAEGVSVSKYFISPSVWGISGSAIGRIGVIAHETGHYLGFPDLYDTDGGGEGIGSWSLMANSWGFTNDQYYPPPLDAWSKIRAGWATSTAISPNDTTPYVLSPQCKSNVVYRINTNFPSGEYLLVENRQKVCLYDSKMGGSSTGGLAIFHIDENQPSYNTEGYPGQTGWPGNGKHYKVAILQADKLYELEKGLNRGNIGDLYKNGAILGPSISLSGPYPNSDSYAYGMGVKKTCIEISNIITAGNNVTSFVFKVSCGATTVKPVTPPKPVVKPVSKPVKKKKTQFGKGKSQK